MEKNKVVFSYRLVITTKKNIVNKFSKTLPSSLKTSHSPPCSPSSKFVYFNEEHMLTLGFTHMPTVSQTQLNPPQQSINKKVF
jgi:hypothetical protein